jgi:hypothetical protein
LHPRATAWVFETISKLAVASWDEFAPDMAFSLFNSRSTVMNDHIGDTDFFTDRCSLVTSLGNDVSCPLAIPSNIYLKKNDQIHRLLKKIS